MLFSVFTAQIYVDDLLAPKLVETFPNSTFILSIKTVLTVAYTHKHWNNGGLGGYSPPMISLQLYSPPESGKPSVNDFVH